MKFSHLLPLAAVTSALVLPTEEVFREIQYEEDDGQSWYTQLMSEKERLLSEAHEEMNVVYDELSIPIEAYEMCMKAAKENTLEMAEVQAESVVQRARGVGSWITRTVRETTDLVEGKVHHFIESISHDQLRSWGIDVNDIKPSWRDVEDQPMDYYDDEDGLFDLGHHHDGGHHGGEDHDHDGHPGHGHHGDHGHGHGSNHTVFELIAHSKYSTTLAKLVSKYPDIVSRLNSTKHNVTVFAPTDKAFEKIPKKVLDKFSKKEVEALLNYHIVPGIYPAGRLLFTQTAPTFLASSHLASKPRPQRLTFRKGLGGLSVNFYSRVIASNIFGSNGVVHGVNSPIFPPIGAIQEIDLFPATFSTLELALTKTDLLDELNSTDHAGGTLFAPNNWAFEKLGPRINAFLFSPAGNKYLKALLLYHVVPENTLYSDAYYHKDPKDDDDDDEEEEEEEKSRNIHVDLPTALEGKSLAIDISRWGPILTFKVNGFTRVAVSDVVAEDGVIHVLTSVLIPPRKPKGADEEEEEEAVVDEGELTLEELVERLEPYLDGAVRKQDLK